MPEFLERKLEHRYGKGNPIVYKTLNSLGYMRGNKETAKGREAERKHRRDSGAGHTLEKRYPRR